MNKPEIREGLGLTSERAGELENITCAIMRQTAQQNGRGITSHTLLTIIGRKDLSELEKVYCTYMFCRMTQSPIKERSSDMPFNSEIPFNMSSGGSGGMSNVIDIDIADMKKGISMNGMMMTSQGVDPRELASVLMAMLVAVLGQLPTDEAKDFCKGASLAFLKMTMTGDMRL